MDLLPNGRVVAEVTLVRAIDGSLWRRWGTMDTLYPVEWPEALRWLRDLGTVGGRPLSDPECSRIVVRWEQE